MSRKSQIEKAKKQQQLIEQYREVCQKLKAKGDYETLAKFLINSNLNRLMQRDTLNGRSRGYMGKFGLSRLNFRCFAHLGQIPDVRKAC